MPQSAIILIVILLWAGIITSIMTARSFKQALNRIVLYLALALLVLIVK